MTLPEFAKDSREKIERRLEELLPSEKIPPEQLHKAMRYAVLGGGKRIRPLLCLTSARTLGGALEEALDAACAIEMVHCFSLVHDDLPALDNDVLRRGKPTCHVVFGEAIALLAGDGLFSLAFETIARMNAPEKARFLAISALAEAAGTQGMVGGETLDLLAENTPVTLEDVKRIHEKKTGALIAASCEIGAIFGLASKERDFDRTDLRIRTLREFGERIGLAFQIIDDVLNEQGDQERLGKPTKSDRERKKATYPALLGIDESTRMAKEIFENALKIIQNFGENATLLKEIASYIIDRKE
ncbi:MAG TPA: farnesyl diphosphate synthase [Fimbriimonadales bacterium]|nr:farnesyl diphosphate synthase [Fimbriimonadales bacterium]